MINPACPYDNGNIIATIFITFLFSFFLFCFAFADRPWYWSVSRLWSELDRAKYRRYYRVRDRAVTFMIAGLDYAEAMRRAEKEINREGETVLISLPEES